MSSDFYRVLSSHYDRLFPAEPSIVRFLAGRLPSVGPILDVACGTGTYTAELLRLGYDVSGIDLSPEMIARGTLPATRLRVGGMLDPASYCERPYGGIYCIGNSVAHLRDLGEVTRFLTLAAVSLRPRGPLILQTINTTRLGQEGELRLPDLEAQDVRMRRTYRADEDGLHIGFEAELGLPDRTLRIEQKLLDLSAAQLVDLLSDAGFALAGRFGSYDGSPFSPRTSFLLLVVAEGRGVAGEDSS
jgi:SAM-dependent methyltransferase